jgi:hypothetical protein
MYVSKVWEFVARSRKRFIASWGLRMSHICPLPPRSKVESRHFAHNCLGGGHGEGLITQILHRLDGQVEVEPVRPDEAATDYVVQDTKMKHNIFIYFFIRKP